MIFFQYLNSTLYKVISLLEVKTNRKQKLLHVKFNVKIQLTFFVINLKSDYALRSLIRDFALRSLIRGVLIMLLSCFQDGLK